MKKNSTDKLIKLCGLYRNVSKQTGREYFSGSFSFGTKLLILENRDAKVGEPPWNLYLTEREQKPAFLSGQQIPEQRQTALPLGQIEDDIPDPGWPNQEATAR